MARSLGRVQGRDRENRKVLADAYRQHSKELYRYCLRQSGSHAIAEEVLGTVFLEAWRRREEIDLTTQPIMPWLYRVAQNVARNHRRTERRQQATASRLEQVNRHHADDPGEELARRQAAQTVVGSLVSLPEVQRQVVDLCVLRGRSYEAAASDLNVPVGTVRSRLYRARLKLALAVRAANGS